MNTDTLRLLITLEGVIDGRQLASAEPLAKPGATVSISVIRDIRG